MLEPNHDTCCANPQLVCPICERVVPHYAGGTVSDVDDVMHVVRAEDYPARGGAVDRRLTNWMHGSCWRIGVAGRGDWRLVAMTFLPIEPVQSRARNAIAGQDSRGLDPHPQRGVS